VIYVLLDSCFAGLEQSEGSAQQKYWHYVGGLNAGSQLHLTIGFSSGLIFYI
jgi:hypothetical protein